ncbi:hypothetical protein Syun_015372 [Stephania yunnanensis]|uniref:Uncharacterized protein n=1 Tax=Stephania yunnanensis TaxID=152371 RepID=A0AAP0P9N2_9MAGN
MGTSKVLHALMKGLKFWTKMNDKGLIFRMTNRDVQQDVDEDIEQEDEEDDQGEPNIEVRRRRTRPETVRERTRRPRPPRPSTQTEVAAESSRPSPPARSSRSRVSRRDNVGESSHSSHGYIPKIFHTPTEPHMFVPVPPSVNLPPYHFDPYAPGLRLHTWIHANASSSNVSITPYIHA